MPPKTPTRTVTFGDDARAKILKGAEVVFQAVKSTYSPLSGNVAIENQFNERSTVTHDGVTVARNITLADPVENIGARMLVDASMKTNDIAGDGTSATVILAYNVLKKANKLIAAGYNPMLMRKGIELAAAAAKDYIDDVAVEVDDNRLRDVATISAGDPELGRLIADTIIDVGVNGGITVEEYQGIGVESEIVEGFYFGKGYDSPYFMTDPDESANFTNARVLVVEDRVTTLGQLEHILEFVATSDNKRIIIIGNITGQAIQQLVANRMKGALEVVSVKPAVFGDQKQLHLEDLAMLTGGKVVMSGTPSSQITEEYLGYAKNVVVTKDSTTIITPKPKAIPERIKALEASIKKEANQFRKENMRKRLAMLEGKIGIIRVGGESETVAREKKMRVDDAVHATQAARDSGIVPGGATALVHASKVINTTPHSYDVDMGFEMVKEALCEPFRQLMTNAGMDSSYNLVQVLENGFGFGYDVLNKSDEPTNLIESGVVDPALVIKQVIENGCAAAGLALTNNAAITFNDDGDNNSADA